MPCKLLKFGQYVNDGERQAAEFLHQKLGDESGQWYLLSNIELQLRATGELREIDLIALGPTGVYVIDVKSFAGDITASGTTWILSDGSTRENPVGHVEDAAKQLKGYLRQRAGGDSFWVAGRLFFTEDQIEFPSSAPQKYCYRRSQYRDMLRLDEDRPQLSSGTLQKLMSALEPGVAIRERAAWERLGEFSIEEAVTEFDTPNRKTFRGRDEQGRPALIRVYDLSGVPAQEREEATNQARAEFTALKSFVAVPHVVSFLANFQPVPGYGGELYYFALEQPTGATLADRLHSDEDYDLTTRLRLMCRLCRAVSQIHETPVKGGSQKTIVHRRLRPDNIYLFEDETSFRLTGFDVARALEPTIYEDETPFELTGYDAPELREGLNRASRQSDIYSLGVLVWRLLSGNMPFDDEPRERDDAGEPEEFPPFAIEGVPAEVLEDLEFILKEMLSYQPQERPASAETVADLLDEILAEIKDEETETAEAAEEVVEPPRHPLPEGSHCGENLVVDQMLAQTPTAYVYKVTDERTGRDYVAKCWRDVSTEQADELGAEFGMLTKFSHKTDRVVNVRDFRKLEGVPYNLLLEYVPGTSFEAYCHRLPERAQTNGMATFELAGKIIGDVLEGLHLVHRHDILHRDLSPENVVVTEDETGDRAVIIDFGISALRGEDDEAFGSGTFAVRAPEVDEGDPYTEQSDLYSVGVLLFMAITDELPYSTAQGVDKATLREDLLSDEELIPGPLSDLLRRTLSVSPTDRPGSALGMREELEAILSGEEVSPELEEGGKLEACETEYLTELLQLYQKSTISNAETRGLDTEFSRRTYVKTKLDQTVEELIRNGDLSLVLLTGNPGDGKTAFLQQLALRLGVSVDELQGQREWTTTLDDGWRVACNLDGSAAIGDMSSDEVLDRFLCPFFDGPPEGETRLVAINDGRLLEWIEVTHEADGRWLFEALKSAVGLTATEENTSDSITIIDLNDRSLVGSANGVAATDRPSVERMIDSLVEGTRDGTRRDDDPWAVCKKCQAQDWCHVKFAVDTLRDPTLGPVVKDRIVDLCQIIHFRGWTHITVRQLRGALSYLLFDLLPCSQIYERTACSGVELENLVRRSFWQRIWLNGEKSFPGELLPELSRLDPGKTDNPAVDRVLRTAAMAQNSDDIFVSGTSRSNTMEESVRALAESQGLKRAMPLLRRRLFFEGSPEFFDEHHITPAELIGYSSFDEFRAIVRGEDEVADSGLHAICEGLSRADRVPPSYSAEHPGVALQSSAEAPVDTVIFRHYPEREFSLGREDPAGTARFVEWLPTSLRLVRKAEEDDAVELRIGLDLFEYLYRLSHGQAPGAPEFDSVFAHLDVFRERLLRLPTREVLALHPMHGHFRIETATEQGGLIRLKRA